MIVVNIKNSHDDIEFDKAVKHFKKLVNKTGVLQELKMKRYYEKPSDKKRRERNEQKRRK